MNKPEWQYMGVVGNDPLEVAEAGSRISSECLRIPPSPAGTVPSWVTNSDFFDGSLLAVAVKDERTVKVWGTAFMIGPGLAVTAKHVLDDHLEEALRGEKEVYCVGLRPGGRLEVWRLQHYGCSNDDGDLAILSLQLVTNLPDDNRFTCLPLTTRTPYAGEQLTIVGFRFEEAEARTEPDTFPLTGNLYTAVGVVTAVHWPRHPLLAPFPVIEIQCGSLGGMSGGSVFGQDGAVVGVISRGFEADDHQGPTFAAWCVDLFRWTVTASWPPGAYPPDLSIVHIPFIRIDGREHYTLDNDGTPHLKIWHGDGHPQNPDAAPQR
ncbi:trypsin-like peptidase domain-containing protein [Mycolicibacterium tusciae]|uniref:trypsin-like peptidase domain-containing protein n=1 Tax=Mycolicibacterium tusciae TaxID=75922 RepID=UPI00024A504D|nr:trypsin-like peptidase domain-containing protein [Mycolicibacterium tusciae]